MEEKLKILLCEDEENLGMLLREYLQAKGFMAELCLDGEAGYKEFLRTKYDICVLDVMMPKKDGFTLAQEIRQANAEIPIIFLTAKQLKDDILEGFKIGADDYITKPFSMEELVLRIEAILLRHHHIKNTDIKLGLQESLLACLTIRTQLGHIAFCCQVFTEQHSQVLVVFTKKKFQFFVHNSFILVVYYNALFNV